MRVLFIGGTGIISSACSRLAVERGMEVFLMTRGKSMRLVPEGAKLIQADIHEPQSVLKALDNLCFDVVVDWVAYTPDEIETDIKLFQLNTSQYVFISSASVYQKPITFLPITESTPLKNPFWIYSRNKIACEDRLMRAYREKDFPVTIVRPSHTYDQTLIPMHGRWTVMDRMLRGQKVIVHGDGTSLWTLTHHRDFAKGFTGLLGNPHAIGEAFHITSDESLTWNQIYETLACALGVQPHLVHIPSERLALYDQEWGDSLLGDKAHSVLFDNSKIKRLVPDFHCTIPYAQGAREVVAWYMADPARREVNPTFNAMYDKIIEDYESSAPN